MRPRSRETWQGFLGAAARGEWESADRALEELFRELPELSPRPGFVDRVLRRVGHSAGFERPWARWTLAASLAAAAFAIGVLVPVLASLSRLVAPSEVLGLWIHAVSDLSIRFGESLGYWQQWTRTGSSLGRALARPEIAALLAANAGLAWFALRRLTALGSGRSGSHVAVTI